MGEHLIEGQFQSDKYLWCRKGFFPMKFTDKKAQPLLWEYSKIMISCGESECPADIQQALMNVGYSGPKHKVVDCMGCTKGETIKVSYDLFYYDRCPICGAQPLESSNKERNS